MNREIRVVPTSHVTVYQDTARLLAPNDMRGIRVRGIVGFTALLAVSDEPMMVHTRTLSYSRLRLRANKASSNKYLLLRTIRGTIGF